MKKIFLSVIMLSLVIAAEAAGKMDSRVRKVPDEITAKVFATGDDTAVAELVRILTASLSETTAKLKVLHDWICDNIAYDTEIYANEKIAEHQSVSEVLKKRKAVCIGYCNVYKTLCSYAGIDVKIISGWSKGVGYPGYIAKYPNHAWNAVKIGNRWVLIDVTWDAGWVDYDEYVKQYTTEWFMKSPKDFIWSHLPIDDEDQFLTKIKTHEEFEQEPYVPCVFFDYGFSFTDKIPGYNNYINDITTDTFNFSKSNVYLSVNLNNVKSGQHFKGYAWFDRYNGKLNITYDIPTADKYTLTIYASGTPGIDYYMSKSEFEQRELPAAEQMLADGRITQAEYDYFISSYRYVDRRNRYYYNEDCFDAPRTNAVNKIYKLFGIPIMNRVLSYYILPAEGYAGCGVNNALFPVKYSNTAKNTVLISPVCRVLQPGQTYTFSIKSMDYKAVAIGGTPLIDKLFGKNAKTNVYQLDYTIPPDAKDIQIYGSADGKQYRSIWGYEVGE